jgi:hypothetical protein
MQVIYYCRVLGLNNNLRLRAVGHPALPGLEINCVLNRANQRTASLKRCTLIGPFGQQN